MIDVGVGFENVLFAEFHAFDVEDVWVVGIFGSSDMANWSFTDFAYVNIFLLSDV